MLVKVLTLTGFALLFDLFDCSVLFYWELGFIVYENVRALYFIYLLAVGPTDCQSCGK